MNLPAELAEFCAKLPPIEHRDVSSLKGAYAADVTAAAYCGFAEPPRPPRGLWQHGWISQQRAVDPAAVIGGYGSYDEQKEREYFWVARKDQEEYLRNCGYRHVKAIGLPIVYQMPANYRRIPGSLLVMPVHSLPYTSHHWKFDEYVDAIAQIRDRFAAVLICVHPTCWQKGYWVNSFRKRGFPVVQGVIGSDRNAQHRLQMFLQSFEFVTTNGYGSHLVYASYYGAKVSIYGPYAKYSALDYADTPLYRNCPHILEPMLRITGEEQVRADYPFLFCAPDQAEARPAWGAHEVGADCRVSPEELCRLFQWTAYYRVRRQIGVALHQARGKLRRQARRLARRVFAQQQPLAAPVAPRIDSVNRICQIYGQPFQFLDESSFRFIHQEIIEREIYRFRTAATDPRIIDGGANIGLATVYFKHLYPSARIDAFEPDPANFAVLEANCRQRGLHDVRRHPCALWIATGRLRFRREASTLGGRLADGQAAADDVEVPTVRLRDLLNEPIHFLKLDVEGAETELLEDCAERLGNVENLFVEYHSFADRPQTLHRLLTVVQAAGFRVHFHVFEPSPRPFWERMERVGIDRLDMNLDIFCYRP